MNRSFPLTLMSINCRRCLALLLSCLLVLPALAEETGADANMPKFDVMEYAVEGNTKLADIAIERAVTPFLGEHKTLRDVEAARIALEGVYHDAGYLTVVVSIPEQDVSGGVVTLNVLEGQVERLRVKGAEYHLASGIKQQVPELAAGNVPYFPEVQRELDALNRGADLKATPVLKAGRAPGMVEVQMDVEDSLPLHGSVEFSNRQSANTTPQRLSGTLRYDNLWQRGHSASLTLQTSPQKTDEVRIAAATYVMPTDDSGNALVGYTVISRSKFATLSGSPGLGLLGNTDVYGLRYAMPLPSYDNYSHSLSVGFDYKDVKQTLVTGGTPDPSAKPITYTPLVAAYNGSWLGNGRTTMLETTVTHGMRGLFGNRDDEFVRNGSSADFFSLRGNMQHTEVFANWSLAGKLEMQIASGPLVANEKFASGGAESVRGYLEGEKVGDSAVHWTVEVRTPKLAFADESAQLKLSGVAFYEGARLRTLQPAPLQPAYWLLRGAGIGLRVSGNHGLNFDLDLARAYDDADITRAGDTRLHSRLLWDF